MLPNLFLIIMKKYFLAIQFRENQDIIESEQRSLKRVFKKFDAEVTFANFFNQSINWNNPQEIIADNNGVILCGSGDFDFDGGRSPDDPKRMMSYTILNGLKHFLQYLFDGNIPTLGICYGHQIIAAFKGKKVMNDKNQVKVGSYNVSILDKYKSDLLFQDMPPTFNAQYGHKDSLSDLPEGCSIIAQGLNCNYSILKYSDYIYSVQFHPELTMSDVLERERKSDGYNKLIDPSKFSLKPSIESELIIRNFINIASH